MWMMVRCTLHDNEIKYYSHLVLWKNLLSLITPFINISQIKSYPFFFSWKMDTLKIQLKLNINIPTSSNFSWKFLDIDGI